MTIQDAYALPTVFNVCVEKNNSDSITYRVSVDKAKKTLSIEVSFREGNFTDSEISEGKELILNGIQNGSLHLPTFIPLIDVKDKGSWQGVHEVLES